MSKLIQIAPVVMPPGRRDQTHEIVVFALDEQGNLWKWDTGMKSGKWVQVCQGQAE